MTSPFGSPGSADGAGSSDVESGDRKMQSAGWGSPVVSTSLTLEPQSVEQGLPPTPTGPKPTWRPSDDSRGPASVFSPAGTMSSNANLQDVGPRRIHIGMQMEGGRGHFPSNQVCTTKYQLWNIVPKNLVEQFHRVANVWFLVVSIFQLLPLELSPTNQYATIVPLCAVLFVTFCKDAYEDYGRRSDDWRVNNQHCQVVDCTVDPVILRATRWKDVAVGNYIRLERDAPVPADMVVLSSSNEDGVAFVDTAQLDGETSLKPKYAVEETMQVLDIWELTGLDGYLDTEQPNEQVQTFNGTLHLRGHPRGAAVDAKNFLLRGSTLRNTQWVFGLVVFTGADTKLVKNSKSTPSKRSHVEVLANRLLFIVFGALVIIALASAAARAVWVASREGSAQMKWAWPDSDPLQDSKYLAFITFMIGYNNLIPISLYVTTDLVRTFQGMLMERDQSMYHAVTDSGCRVRSAGLCENLGQVEFVLSDKTGTLTENKMSFKACCIGGRNYGCWDDKLGPVDHVVTVPPRESCLPLDTKLWYIAPSAATREPLDREASLGPLHHHLVDDFFLCMATCHTAIVEELPTPEEQQFRSSGSMGSWSSGGLHRRPPRKMSTQSAKNMARVDFEAEFLRPRPELVAEARRTTFRSSSPDEEALVAAARDYGYFFRKKVTSQLTVNVRGQDELYHALACNEFTPDRKRMSVLLRRSRELTPRSAATAAAESSAGATLYVKGADNVMLERMRRDDSGLGDQAREQLRRFASCGLRTLVFAKREISAKQAESFVQRLHDARGALMYRETRMEEVADEMEQNLEFLGISAIEDQIQEGVPDAINDLLRAGIKVWMLTGDNMETAINIGIACRLLDTSSKQYMLDAGADTPAAAVMTKLNEYYNDIRFNLLRGRVGGDSFRYSVVVHGSALYNIMDESNLRMRQLFLTIACSSSSLIACRLAPAQKAALVKLLRNNIVGRPLTLAIGDGANDVSMIQEAHVGVGILGVEGRQAANASDFVIGQFRFLQTLLLVHGRWNLRRIGIVLGYSFYKNFTLVLPMVYYAFYTGFSGTTLYDSYLLTCYNLFFTSLPILLTGIFDFDVMARMSLLVPSLYQLGIRGKYFNGWMLIGWIARGVLHSLLIFALIRFIFDGSVADNDGRMMDYLAMGTWGYWACVTVVNITLLLHTKAWTYCLLIVSVGSVLIFVPMLWLYSQENHASMLNSSMVGVSGCLFGRLGNWLALLLVGAASAAIEVAIAYARKVRSPDADDIVQEVQLGYFSGATITETTVSHHITSRAASSVVSSCTPVKDPMPGDGPASEAEKLASMEVWTPLREMSLDTGREPLSSGTSASLPCAVNLDGPSPSVSIAKVSEVSRDTNTGGGDYDVIADSHATLQTPPQEHSPVALVASPPKVSEDEASPRPPLAAPTDMSFSPRSKSRSSSPSLEDGIPGDIAIVLSRLPAPPLRLHKVKPLEGLILEPLHPEADGRRSRTSVKVAEVSAMLARQCSEGADVVRSYSESVRRQSDAALQVLRKPSMEVGLALRRPSRELSQIFRERSHGILACCRRHVGKLTRYTASLQWRELPLGELMSSIGYNFKMVGANDAIYSLLSLRFYSASVETSFRKYFSGKTAYVIWRYLWAVAATLLMCYSYGLVALESCRTGRRVVAEVVIVIVVFTGFCISWLRPVEHASDTMVVVSMLAIVALKQILDMLARSPAFLGDLYMPFLIMASTRVRVAHLAPMFPFHILVSACHHLLPFFHEDAGSGCRAYSHNDLEVEYYLLMVLMVAMCSSHAYLLEKVIRQDFLIHHALVYSKIQAQELLRTMFPDHVVQHVVRQTSQLSEVLDTHTAPMGDRMTSEEYARAPTTYDISEIREDCGIVTVLFCDICDFEMLIELLQPADLVLLLDRLWMMFDRTCQETELTKIETVGKTYMAAALMLDVAEGATIALLTATGMLSQVKQHKLGVGRVTSISVRIGIHTGPCMCGVVGSRKPQFALFGDTVNTASRMQSTGEKDHVHISHTTRIILGADQRFSWQPRRTVVKGKGEMDTYLLLSYNVESRRRDRCSTSPVYVSESEKDRSSSKETKRFQRRRPSLSLSLNGTSAGSFMADVQRTRMLRRAQTGVQIVAPSIQSPTRGSVPDLRQSLAYPLHSGGAELEGRPEVAFASARTLPADTTLASDSVTSPLSSSADMSLPSALLREGSNRRSCAPAQSLPDTSATTTATENSASITERGGSIPAQTWLSDKEEACDEEEEAKAAEPASGATVEQKEEDDDENDDDFDDPHGLHREADFNQAKSEPTISFSRGLEAFNRQLSPQSDCSGVRFSYDMSGRSRSFPRPGASEQGSTSFVPTSSEASFGGKGSLWNLLTSYGPRKSAKVHPAWGKRWSVASSVGSVSSYRSNSLWRCLYNRHSRRGHGVHRVSLHVFWVCYALESLCLLSSRYGRSFEQPLWVVIVRFGYFVLVPLCTSLFSWLVRRYGWTSSVMMPSEPAIGATVISLAFICAVQGTWSLSEGDAAFWTVFEGSFHIMALLHVCRLSCKARHAVITSVIIMGVTSFLTAMQARSSVLVAEFLAYTLVTMCLQLMAMFEDPRLNDAEHKAIRREYDRLNRLLDTMLPKEVLREMKSGNLSLAYNYNDVIFLFADIVGFTGYCAAHSAEEAVNLVTQLFSEFDANTMELSIYKVCTIGDAYVVVNEPRTHVENMCLDCERVFAMAERMIEIIVRVRDQVNHDALDMRIGMHCGCFVGGVIGTKRVRFDIWGEDVIIANSIESEGKAGKICVSEQAKKVLSVCPNLPPLHFTFNVDIELKNKRVVTSYVCTSGTPATGWGGDDDAGDVADADAAVHSAPPGSVLATGTP